MGFSIQIRFKDELIIPSDSKYVPPRPDLPNYISLDGQDMKVITHIMIATGVVDRAITSSKEKAKTKPDAVPVYKFLLNEGYVVTSKEAQLIAVSLASHDILGDDFLKKVFPTLKQFEQAHKDYIGELMGVWIPFNRVAAANNGYTIK